MNSKGQWMDNNVMIEGPWWSLKYERVYLNAFKTGSEARNGIDKWIRGNNEERPHSSLDERAPCEAHWNLPKAGYPVQLVARWMVVSTLILHLVKADRVVQSLGFTSVIASYSKMQ